ncbi:MAG: hypothetical protein BWZ05_00071 [Bacteroidetes bacterium ADurb.BinA245]|nr:MAG: hypothetical protein BWZ05_00071 [Bacteroidetes bacterium ADurb.BinA245]
MFGGINFFIVYLRYKIYNSNFLTGFNYGNQ